MQRGSASNQVYMDFSLTVDLKHCDEVISCSQAWAGTGSDTHVEASIGEAMLKEGLKVQQQQS